MTVLVDTSVVMYAGGRSHPHRAACRRVLQQVADGRLDATASSELVQEVLRRFSTGDRDRGSAMARSAMTLLGPLLVVDHEVVARTTELFERHPQLSARDAIHAATVWRHQLDAVVSVDTDFDALPDLRRIAPDDL